MVAVSDDGGGRGPIASPSAPSSADSATEDSRPTLRLSVSRTDPFFFEGERVGERERERERERVGRREEDDEEEEDERECIFSSILE